MCTSTPSGREIRKKFPRGLEDPHTHTVRVAFVLAFSKEPNASQLPGAHSSGQAPGNLFKFDRNYDSLGARIIERREFAEFPGSRAPLRWPQNPQNAAGPHAAPGSSLSVARARRKQAAAAAAAAERPAEPSESIGALPPDDI